jgi:hypothetical protein
MGGELGKLSDIRKNDISGDTIDFNASQTRQYRTEQAAHKAQTWVQMVFFVF